MRYYSEEAQDRPLYDSHHQPKQPAYLSFYTLPTQQHWARRVHKGTDMRARLLETTQTAQTGRQCLLWPSQRVCQANRRSPRISQQLRALPVDDLDLKQLLGQGYLRPDFEEYSDEHVCGVLRKARSSSSSSSTPASASTVAALDLHTHLILNHDNFTARCDTAWSSVSRTAACGSNSLAST